MNYKYKNNVSGSYFFNILTGSFLFLFIILSFQQVKAQQNDAGLWANIYLEKKLVKHLNAHLNQQYRWNNNISTYHLGYADMGLTYKVAKFMNATLDYVFMERRYISNKYNSEYFSARHQFYFDLTFKYDINNLKIHYRSMVQAQIKDVYSSEAGKVPSYYFRNKLTLQYNLSRRLKPYLACEIYYNFLHPSGNEFDRTRYFGGIFYALSLQNELEFYYLIQRNYNVKDPTNDYVIGLGFSHIFK